MKFLQPCFLKMLPLLLASVPGALQVQGQQAQCPLQNGTMSGTYIMSASGTLNGNPFAQLAKVIYDGQGNGMATLTVSNNGTIAENINVVGTFTVNRDCTGTKTFGAGPSAAHFDFVITPDGKTITWIRTDTNFVLIGTAVRMDH